MHWVLPVVPPRHSDLNELDISHNNVSVDGGSVDFTPVWYCGSAESH